MMDELRLVLFSTLELLVFIFSGKCFFFIHLINFQHLCDITTESDILFVNSGCDGEGGRKGDQENSRCARVTLTLTYTRNCQRPYFPLSFEFDSFTPPTHPSSLWCVVI